MTLPSDVVVAGTTATDAGSAGQSAVPPAVALPAWPQVLARLTAGQDLPDAWAAWVMDQMMTGEAGDALTAAALVALRAKGETVDEIAAMAAVMTSHALPLDLVPGRIVADVVGTGGDGMGTVNISTAAAVVAAAAGACVVKHGNRAASSRCGSADVLEELGIDIDPGPGRVAQLADSLGIAFCFAQRFHPAMRHAGTVRRRLGIRTAFNLLGPLTNPARPRAMAVGIADAAWAAPLISGVLARGGVSALVFRGDDGLDELTTTAVNEVWVVSGAAVARARLDALDLGLPRATVADLAGGDAAANAAILNTALDGGSGAVADVIALNAAAVLVAADLAQEQQAGDPEDATSRSAAAAGEVAGRLPELLAAAVVRSREALVSGAAAGVLTRWAAATPHHAPDRR